MGVQETGPVFAAPTCFTPFPVFAGINRVRINPGGTMVRGVRGAITVESNTAEAIRNAAHRLLAAIMDRNGIELEQIASVVFSVTKDIDAESPAYGVRQMGLVAVPLFSLQEMEVPGSLARCVRVLVHINTDKSQDEIRHVYLDGAVVLRPDIAGRE